MLELHEEIEVERSPADAWAYVADFRTAAEWDATAFETEKLDSGPVRVGTRFNVRCALPLGSILLVYTVMELVPSQTVRLKGTCRYFEVEDIIEFSATESGTHIDYRACFTFSGPLDKFVGGFESAMRKMGRDALAGLKAALDDDYPAPDFTADNTRADRWVLPGLSHFTRAGYRRGRKRWNPMSASMSGKHVVITGASAGLGKATALRLAELGANLTLVIRDERKADALLKEVEDETGNTNCRVELADLSLMADVDDLVARLKRRRQAIDVLINNAGALFNPRQVTAEGLEQSFALLLLSPYRLTLGLLPLLRKAEDARVVNVVSGGMYTQRLEVDKLIMGKAGYSGSTAYARAKRALMVMTEEWAEQWADEGITINAMHPGWADTPGVVTALPAFHKLTRRILRSPLEGADTIVWLAVASEAGKASGKLFLDREPRGTYLLSGTREAPGEREALIEFLESFDIGLYSETAEVSSKASG